MSSVTIEDVTTELYDTAEAKAALATVGITGRIETIKARYRLRTYRLFWRTEGGRGSVMFAPSGFTWRSGLLAASATTMKTRRLYFEKAQVDALVASLA